MPERGEEIVAPEIGERRVKVGGIGGGWGEGIPGVWPEEEEGCMDELFLGDGGGLGGESGERLEGFRGDEMVCGFEAGEVVVEGGCLRNKGICIKLLREGVVDDYLGLVDIWFYYGEICDLGEMG